ncbi:RstC protein [Vibrio vulnificus]|uniref:hypothetical protein n=1 Tax=Vibrio vulnificus TaxID=672 RepID=UPI0004F8EB22|nr:hypothetical protein [Vibrio vulnificus]AIL70634.1 hypothetical protein VV93_v1c15440 [Vibrio vulnificus]AIL72863.1 RstC protein (modular protein) [Vibrio vulnificus]EHZ7344324.1 RstC protein [Vibrio vulnificus]PWY26959.1 RstC protein [Vibrio vulnificus]HAS6170405.1 RstC protein [Vibrio vulnificus]
MTIKEYTLQDAEAKLNEISNIALFLSSGSCPGEMTQNLNNHMLDEIETLQGILSFMRVYPELKAAELAEAS